MHNFLVGFHVGIIVFDVVILVQAEVEFWYFSSIEISRNCLVITASLLKNTQVKGWRKWNKKFI